MEFELECGDFKVMEMLSLQEQDYEGNDRIGLMPLSVGSQVIHIVNKQAGATVVQLRRVAGIPLSVPPWVHSVSEVGGERPKIRAQKCGSHVLQVRLCAEVVQSECVPNMH